MRKRDRRVLETREKVRRWKVWGWRLVESKQREGQARKVKIKGGKAVICNHTRYVYGTVQYIPFSLRCMQSRKDLNRLRMLFVLLTRHLASLHWPKAQSLTRIPVLQLRSTAQQKQKRLRQRTYFAVQQQTRSSKRLLQCAQQHH